jgi:SNF2 family DNA or RNA helicase
LNERERSAELRRWRHEGRFLIATSSTGGRGLTLNEAAYTLFYENEFKYDNRLQSEDRNHRDGQTRRPTYIDVLAQCGIEQRIMNSHSKKGDAVADFRREIGRLKDLSRKDVKEAVRKLI